MPANSSSSSGPTSRTSETSPEHQISLGFLEESLPSVQGIPASPSALLGSEKERTTTATSGLQCARLSRLSGPLGLFVKMCLGTSAWGSTRCSLIWRATVTPHNRLLFQLLALERGTIGTEFGLFPTPNKKDGDGFYVVTKAATLNRIRDGKQTHWPQIAILLTDLEKGWANPSFGEFLMGYPIRWSALKDSETPSSHRSRKSSSRGSRKSKLEN